MNPTFIENLVSIILPTYNRCSLLSESIQSILDQTYTYFELIIIDDGSTDDTKYIVTKFNDSRIKYIYQKNQGRSNARNNAILISRGEFITFLDDDDLYAVNKLEVQTNILKTNMVVYSSALCFTSKAEENFYKYEASCSGNIYEKIALYLPHPICLPTVMVRRNVLIDVGLFDPELERFEDIDLWRRISKTYEFKAIIEPLCFVRTHQANSIESLNMQELANQVEKYIRKTLNEDLAFRGLVLIKLSQNLVKHYKKAIREQTGGRRACWSLSIRTTILFVTVWMRIKINSELSSKNV